MNLASYAGRGSSPRMRGTLAWHASAAMATGIIPAYAGNTTTARHQPSDRWDHPRVCGEHADKAGGDLDYPGSSPRMRGTLSVTLTFGNSNGIIPAYAGNTSHTRKSLTVKWDHPRVCGEHTRVLTDIDQQLGSSPRMRGTLCFHEIVLHDTGIIPAYAGNTRIFEIRWWYARDHPRVCGEHRPRRRVRYTCSGSSPRMRGTLTVQYLGLGYSGIIPAYAGNTKRWSAYAYDAGDHPRVCGEHTD